MRLVQAKAIQFVRAHGPIAPADPNALPEMVHLDPEQIDSVSDETAPSPKRRCLQPGMSESQLANESKKRSRKDAMNAIFGAVDADKAKEIVAAQPIHAEAVREVRQPGCRHVDWMRIPTNASLSLSL